MINEIKLDFNYINVLYFLIGFILYSLLDIAWCKFIYGVKENNPILAALASLAITFFVFIMNWIIYIEKNIYGLLGSLLGAFCGSYFGCIIVNKNKENK